MKRVVPNVGILQNRTGKRNLVAGVLAMFSFALPCVQARAEEQFKDVEIRVIKQKFFQKRMRLELGLNAGAIMNKSFIYTFMGGGDLAFHFSESISVFGEGYYGYTRNKGDCDIIGKTFKIGPVVEQINFFAGAGLNITPIYGKYQLPNGDVIYFDWFFTGGGGIANMRSSEINCLPDDSKAALAETQTQFNFGTGQRYFIDKNLALVWQIRDIITVDPKKFDPKKTGSTLTSNLFVTLGLGYFL